MGKRRRRLSNIKTTQGRRLVLKSGDCFSHLFSQPAHVFDLSAVVRRRAQYMVGLCHGLLHQNVDVGVDGVEPLVSDVLVRAPQQHGAATVRRVQLNCPFWKFGHHQISAEKAEFEGDCFSLGPGGGRASQCVFSAAGARVSRAPSYLVQGGSLLKVRRHFSQVFHCNTE